MANTTNTYVAVTIGPVFDTINLSSSPAALWAASYFFSSLTANICAVLTEDYAIDHKDIVSPYYDKDSALLNQNNGVGLFHDRIIFRVSSDFDISCFEEIRKTAIDHTAKQFGLNSEKNLAYLYDYIMVSYKKFEGNNPIIDSEKLLDCLELAKPFVFSQETNPLFDLFINAPIDKDDEDDVEPPKKGKNEAIKSLIHNFKSFQLVKHKDETSCILKSIKDIVRTRRKTGLKKYKYYAIVRADGDSMSKLIKTLGDDDKINRFSQTCLQYCSDVAGTVAEYDGVTIYAGGDDLLAILPCQSGDDAKTVFHFIQDTNKLFREAFKDFDVHPTLSFGVTIAYYRFPLYEALEDSYFMLSDYAKKNGKNAVAVRLQKHSGQSEGLIISNTALDTFISQLDSVLEKSPDILLSTMHKFHTFAELFNSAQSKKNVENLCINTFDAPAHNKDFLHKTLPELFWGLRDHDEKYQIKAITYDKDGKLCVTQDKPSTTIQYILRIMKFFVEKGGDL